MNTNQKPGYKEDDTSRPTQNTRNPEDHMNADEKEEANKRSGTADYGNTQDPDNADNKQADDAVVSEYSPEEQPGKLGGDDEMLPDEDLGKERLNQDKSASSYKGGDNRPGEDVE